jgi:hypothetical protein
METDYIKKYNKEKSWNKMQAFRTMKSEQQPKHLSIK